MQLVRVVPLSSGNSLPELSYFSSQDIPLGSIVRIPLRTKESFALVVGSEAAGDLKQTLRRSPYPIKKLSAPAPARVLRRSYLRAMFAAAQYEAVPWGTLIATFAPVAVLKRRNLLPEAPEEDEVREVAYEPLLFIEARRERVAEYRRLARECLARGSSLLIIAPTITEADSLAEDLRRGIEGYVETLHSGLSEKKLTDAWKRIAQSQKPLLVIGTLAALSAPRADIQTIVLERATSRSYRRDEYPRVHGARIAEAVAKALGARFIIAATVPPLEAAARRERGDIGDYGITSTRLTGPTPVIVDLRGHKKEKGVWKPLAPESLSVLSAASSKKHVLVLATRRGLSPLTVCDDCGTPLSCRTCGRHLVLHAEKGREFVCHHCNSKESASVRCSVCGGWRLTTLGIAIDKVAETVLEALPQKKILVVSQDKGTQSERIKQLALWRKEGGVLVGTELVLPYLPNTLDTIIVASVDSLLSIPEYSSSERAFTLLAELRTRAKEKFVIQTRDPGNRVIRAIESGMYGGYVKEELADRVTFGYPPATTLVRLSVTAKLAAATKLIQDIEVALGQFSPIRLGQSPARRGEVCMRLFIKLPQGAWVDQRLLRFIRTLPRNVTVEIDPYSIHS